MRRRTVHLNNYLKKVRNIWKDTVFVLNNSCVEVFRFGLVRQRNLIWIVGFGRVRAHLTFFTFLLKALINTINKLHFNNIPNRVFYKRFSKNLRTKFGSGKLNVTLRKAHYRIVDRDCKVDILLIRCLKCKKNECFGNEIFIIFLNEHPAWYGSNVCIRSIKEHFRLSK